MKRVAITGIGAVTPIGSGKQRFWDALLAGKSGIGPVQSFDTSAFQVHLGAEVHDFAAGDFVRRLDPSRLGRASQMAVAAARMALEDAGLAEDVLDRRRTGVSM